MMRHKPAREIGAIVGVLVGIVALLLNTISYAVTGGFYSMCNPAWSPDCEPEGTTYGLTLDPQTVDLAVALAAGFLAFLITTLLIGAWRVQGRGRQPEA